AIHDVKQLAGKKICGMNPPNLGTLALTAEFDNPARQPVIVDSMGWENIYHGVVYQNRCVAGILPVANLNLYDRNGDYTRVIHRTRILPNQALSAGPPVTREEQAKIASALVAPEAAAATAKLRAAYGSEKGFARASREEYAGLDSYLKDVWGYAR
ncbi:MAG: PhnD/SsuA/transferrin family substrate-binding protein, partial [Gammaproteobacteria bacterium]|nr:PhnD/SsuA/transferrin family substrate-binding protein [Gammaproteobacteria bacterium]